MTTVHRKPASARRLLVGAALSAVALVACVPDPAVDPGTGSTTTAPTTTTTSTTTSTTTTTTLPPAEPTMLEFRSDAGDYIGQGKYQRWTPADGTFAVTRGGSRVQVAFDGGSNNWSLNFSAPVGGQIVPGAFESAERYPFQSPTRPGLSVSGSGRGCNTLSGRFDITQLLTDANGLVTRFAAEFEQHCEGGTAALRGTIRWNAATAFPLTDNDGDGTPNAVDNCRFMANPSQVDGDADTIGDVCDKSVGNTSLRYRSDTGDYIGQALSRTWFPQDGTFVSTNNTATHVGLRYNGGPEYWSIDMTSPTALVPGTYTGATRYPFNSPTLPGFTFSGTGRGCNTSTSTFTVKEVAVNPDGTLAKLAVDFEQHCENKTAALYGSVRYQASSGV